jgi:hypothetical protein
MTNIDYPNTYIITNEKINSDLLFLINQYKEHGIDLENEKYKYNLIRTDFLKLPMYRKTSSAYDIEYSSHINFLSALLFIRYFSPNEYKNYIKDLWQPVKNVNIYGHKFEILAHLIFFKKSIKFKKLEPTKGKNTNPDFEIIGDLKNDYKENVYIECGSCQFLTSSTIESRDFEKKIIDTINSKNSQPYSKNNTALFLNISNLYFLSLKEGKRLDENIIISILNRVDNLQYGSVATLMLMFLKGGTIAKWQIVRHDNKNIDSSLKNFLDLNLVKNKIEEGNNETEMAFIQPNT